MNNVVEEEVINDIVEEVLVRLPVKALVRCKTLSKNWYNFISYNKPFRERYLSINKGARSSLMLGFFFTKQRININKVDGGGVRFFHTSDEGRSLLSKKRKRVCDGDDIALPSPLHLPVYAQSLSFLGHRSVHIFGSSNGFLLCSPEQYYPKNYVICNPITKQRVTLPIPEATSEYVAHGFICNASSSCFNSIQRYTVVRAISPGPLESSTSLTIELISSDSPNKWKLFVFNFPFAFYIAMPVVSNVVISEDGIMFLPILVEPKPDYALLVFDQHEQWSIMEFPPPKTKKFRCYHFGQSDGLLLYVMHEHELQQLRIWVMDISDGRRQWCLKHDIRLEITTKSCPELVECSDEELFDFEAFHPTDPRLIFISIGEKMVLYDVSNSTLELLYDFSRKRWYTDYLMFPYMYGLIGRHLFFDA
ncbi:hypothetical protein ACHQM5_028180 [Ranunculus cassubicifolius]